VSGLKLDRSFVTDVGSAPGSTAIVAAVIGLAHGLDLDVVAEGVETDQQADVLASMGCPQGLGFLFGRPEPEPGRRP
jgi:EAL domain-containing protein (putative c-di-GMP-specific phosphodiesterase class I)